jgi:putative selenium metabolism protein SsnA
VRLFTDATIITNDAEDRVIEGGCIGVEDETITYVGLPESAPPAVEERISLPHRVILPGQILAHTHLYSFLARGLSPSRAPADFVDVLEHLWWRLDQAMDLEDVYWSAMGGALSALLCGTTTIIDHHASPSCIGGSLDQIARALGHIGIRGLLSYEITDRHGHRGALEGVEENLRGFALAAQRPGWLAARTGLHASFTLDDRTLDTVAERCSKGVHVHVAEDAADVSRTRERYGEEILPRLVRRGLLTAESILVHGVHLSGPDLTAIARADAFLVHNPRSNMNNGVGAADLAACAKEGVRLALGTDGMGSDPVPEMMAAMLLLRHEHRDPSAGWNLVKDMYCKGNPALASRAFGLTLGRLEVGAAADLVVRRYEPPTPLTADNWWGHQLFGLGDAPVDRVVAGGRELVRGGEPVELDAGRIWSACRDRARGLWARW